jgi:uncharacterized protein (DUF433 family)
MTVSARDVAAKFLAELGPIEPAKMRALLHHAQGHHLAYFGVPLWDDEDDGPAAMDSSTMDNAQLNTIGYVASRYGVHAGAEPFSPQVSAMLAGAEERRREANQRPASPDTRESLQARIDGLRAKAGPQIITDPRWSWGAPVLARSKVSVEAIQGAFGAGESIATICDEYGLTVDEVEAALRYRLPDDDFYETRAQSEAGGEQPA